jgi:hypothetical protein
LQAAKRPAAAELADLSQLAKLSELTTLADLSELTTLANLANVADISDISAIVSNVVPGISGVAEAALCIPQRLETGHTDSGVVIGWSAWVTWHETPKWSRLPIRQGNRILNLGGKSGCHSQTNAQRQGACSADRRRRFEHDYSHFQKK